MLFFGIKNVRFKIILLTTFGALSAVFAFLIYRDYFITDPLNLELTGTERYGHNSAGDFQQYILMILIEFVIIAAVLTPYSFSRFYWIRLLLLQFLFGGWMILTAVAGMHAGGVHALHTLYLLGVNAVIFILLAASIAAEISSRRKMNKD